MLCSTSIDGKLRIWNLKNNTLAFDSGSPNFLKTYKLGDVLNTVHNIIGADYVPNHKGYIVTWQFTPEVTIWNPQYSVQNPYIGKYTSHLCPVTSCRLLKTSTFCVSVDKRMILRVWDVRTLTTSQVLNLDANFDTRPYLHVLPDDNLLLFGRHPRKLANQNFALRKMHSVCAVGVAFNEYHKKFIVATPIDVRLYDCETGKLNEIFVDLVEAGRTIKCFEQGARHRMFYLGDSAGDVNMFNTKNGQKLKSVTDAEKDNEVVERFSKIMGMQVQQGHFSHHDKDICCMLYLTDEKLLAVGTGNSIIKIYAEVDSEESELSRVFVGGHMDSEISCLAFNRETSQFASGSENGIVTIWNMNTGKVDNTFFDLPSKVVSIAFCQPWSCILVAQAIGVLSVWGLKQVGNEYSGKSVLKLFHLSPDFDSRMLSIKSVLTLYTNQMVFHKSFMPEEDLYAKEKNLIVLMSNSFKQAKKDIESVKVTNDFTLSDLERDSGPLYFRRSPTIVRQNSKIETPSQEEFLYVLIGDEKGNLITLNLLPILRQTKFPPPQPKSETFLQTAPSQPNQQQQATDEASKKVVDINRAESIMALSQTRLYMNTVPTRVLLRNVFPLTNPAVVSICEGASDASVTGLSFVADKKTLLLGSLESDNVRLWRDKHTVGAINLRGHKESLPKWLYQYDWKGEAYLRAAEIIKIELELNGVSAPDPQEIDNLVTDKVKQMFLSKRSDLYASAMQIVELSRHHQENSVSKNIRGVDASKYEPKVFVFEEVSTSIKKEFKSPLKSGPSKTSTKILLNTTVVQRDSLEDLDKITTAQNADLDGMSRELAKSREKSTQAVSPVKPKGFMAQEPLKNLKPTDSTTFNKSFRFYHYPDRLELAAAPIESSVLRGLENPDPRDIMPKSDLAKALQLRFQTEESKQQAQKRKLRMQDAPELHTPRLQHKTFSGLSRSKVENQFRLSTSRKTLRPVAENSTYSRRDGSPGEYYIPSSGPGKTTSSIKDLKHSRSSVKIPNSFQEFMSNVKESYNKMQQSGNKNSSQNLKTGKLKLLMNLSRGVGITSESANAAQSRGTEESVQKEHSLMASAGKPTQGSGGTLRRQPTLQSKLEMQMGANNTSIGMVKAASLYESQWLTGVEQRAALQGKIQLAPAGSPRGETSIRRALTQK